MAAKKKNNKVVKIKYREYLVYFFIIFLVLLSSFNVASYLTPKKQTVLGIVTSNDEGVFWYKFLKDNPDYIPGWIEINRPDKVANIDPNYL